CSFPVPKLLGLFDAFSGLIVEVLCFPLFTHEMSQVCKVHPLLGRGDLLVGDPRLLLVRPSGTAAPEKRPGLLPHAPAADRQLPRRPQETSQRAEGQTPQHVPQASGQTGPTGAVAQAAPTAKARVDRPPAVPLSAGDADAARVALPPGGQGTTHAPSDDRDHVAGSAALSQGKDRPTLRHSLAGGDPPGGIEDDAED